MDWMAQEQERGITITSAATTCGFETSPPHQHPRHTRPRRLHHRGGAIATRPRRRRRRLRLGRRRRAPDRDCVAAGQQVPGAADLLRQQDGPHRRRLLPHCQDDRGPARVHPRRHPAADRRRGSLPRGHRSRHDDGPRVGRDHRQGRAYDEIAIPAEYRSPGRGVAGQAARHRRPEDDDLMEKYSRDVELVARDIDAPSATAPWRSRSSRSLCGSAFKNKGVQPMLDAVVDFLPSPFDIPPATGLDLKGIEVLEVPPTRRRRSRRWRSRSWPTRSAASPTSGVLGEASTRAPRSTTPPRSARSGSAASSRCTRTTARTSTRPWRATSCRPRLQEDHHRRHVVRPDHPIVLERMEFPEPVIHVAIEPKTKADQDKLGKALYSLSDEDPTFRVRTDDETGQTVISGMGELHLEVLVDRMLRRVQRRRHRRQAAGRLPRDDHPRREERRLPPRQADRRRRASSPTS